MAQAEVTEFLTHLAREGKVAGSTQNQALSALLFLYKEVLKQEIGWLDGVERAKKPARLPVVLTRDEVHKIFAHLHGTNRLMAGLLYGSGLRLMECVRLRVKDVDFAYAQITVRDAKGGKDRVTMLPREFGRTASTPFGQSEGAARAGHRGWIWKCASAVCARKKISQCASRMGLAIPISFLSALARSARRVRRRTATEAASPYGRRNLAGGAQESGTRIRD